MTIIEILLLEFDQEIANTRKILERVPANRMEWRPHEKSMTMGRLAGHIAELPTWAASIIKQDSLDLTPMVQAGQRGYEAGSLEELLRMFEKNAAECRRSLEASNDEHLNQIWQLHLEGKTILSLPRFQLLRGTFMNHLIHHRGQLEVYLRLNDVPLPPLYGPTADEGAPFGAAKQ